ncbi:toll/interleukin-1 receptor domain-containing protein [Azospirillum sp. Sh1]|uniref:toll/interleukin-1 receptor domain-containing protein n=1 Tax=Azospirillum sp. Sh1 TaxID=2607285 RepID=UPI0011ED1304|nr:toll/interleukin-1 receptor domain-containing protein [Azospirillum sp. Sh1]KAA0570602.1 toll/interleukin-1 receptor domain-containing protein [Azospirillum sp. Sh1]
MSVSTERNRVARIQKDIADLRVKDAQEAKKEADLTAKMVRASTAAQSSKSASTISSKMNEASRASNDIASVQQKRADIAKSIASKLADLNRAQTSLEKAEDSDRKKAAADQKKADDMRARQLKQLEQQLRDQQQSAFAAPITISMPATKMEDDILPEYDVFISHASEDKDSFVRPFAEKLTAAGITPFYDEISITWGDSLRRRIDQGLARSRFGIVILSKNFFAKAWPQRELDGLVALEIQGQSRILPIWHEVSKDEVARFSPSLADKVALNTSLLSISEIIGKLLPLCGKTLPPKSSKDSNE